MRGKRPRFKGAAFSCSDWRTNLEEEADADSRQEIVGPATSAGGAGGGDEFLGERRHVIPELEAHVDLVCELKLHAATDGDQRRNLRALREDGHGLEGLEGAFDAVSFEKLRADAKEGVGSDFASTVSEVEVHVVVEGVGLAPERNFGAAAFEHHVIEGEIIAEFASDSPVHILAEPDAAAEAGIEAAFG